MPDDVFSTQIQSEDPAALQVAAGLLRAGQVVAFPTETVYGLGANALDQAAVQRIFTAKRRPADNPLIVHIADISSLPPLIDGEPSAAAQRLMAHFWPGPLTLIFKRSDIVPDVVTASLDTVAVRLPAHPIAQKLIELSGLPIAAPSANASGRPSPTRAAHVLEDMDGRIPMIIDGGACEVGLESTVLDLSGDRPTLLRPGAVTREQLQDVLGEPIALAKGVAEPLAQGEVARSPGLLHTHYAPRAHVTIFDGSEEQATLAIAQAYDEAQAMGERCAILCLNPNREALEGRTCILLGADAQDAAESLFHALRLLDQQGITRAFAYALPQAGIGLAVMNRLSRAAGFDIIHVGRF